MPRLKLAEPQSHTLLFFFDCVVLNSYFYFTRKLFSMLSLNLRLLLAAVNFDLTLKTLVLFE